jgi:hypothetical protein
LKADRVQYDMRVGYISACRTLPLGFVGGLAGLIAGGLSAWLPILPRTRAHAE